MTDATSARWRQVDALYHQALARDPAEREAFLNEVCAGDPRLRRELDSLLGYEEAAHSFLGGSALAEAARSLAVDAPQLVGRHLAGYEVLAWIGSGGMGDVYRARDLRLGREVALKVLDPLIAADPAYRHRFEEEARSASVLNHPNIVTIYGVGDDDGLAVIAMELVQGRTLRDVMSAGTAPLAETLDLAAQMAAGLAAAHAHDIVHRDLKPENVMVTADGRVKVLDFGIAKRRDATDLSFDRGATGDRGQSPVVEGTVGYMSPEQASGRRVGPASDQFSLGAILYEMLAGRRAFHRDSKIETLAAICEVDPVPVQTLNPAVPAGVRRMVARCLAKDPAGRYADTRDLERDLRGLQHAASHAVIRRRLLWLGSGAAAAALAGTTTWALWPPHSLAVLPFANAARDEGIDYLCMGIAENLIGRLRHLPIAVKSFSLVSHFAGTSADARAIGLELGVESLITGSVRAESGHLLISVALIDLATGNTLWSGRYDRATADIFKLWDEIATAIVDDGLRLRLTRDERRALLSRPTDHVEAFDMYLRARRFQMEVFEEDYLAARTLLQRAVDLDPRFADAWLSLAGTYWTSGLENFAPPGEARTGASACVARAAAENPRLANLPFGRAILAFFFDWKWTDAAREWRLAWAAPDRELQPELLLPYALAQWALGRPRDALRIVQRARAVDPLSPMFMLHEASYLRDTGQYDAAADRCLSVISTHPAQAAAHLALAEVRRAQRRFDEAIAARRNAHTIRGDTDEELLQLLSAARGEEGYALIEETAVRQLELRTLVRRSRHAYVSSLDFARAYAQLDDLPRAYEFLTQAIDEKAPGLVFLHADRAWDRLRSAPEFQAAVTTVGLPPRDRV